MSKNSWLFILPTDSIQGSEHIVKSLAHYVKSNQNKVYVIVLTKKRNLGWASEEDTLEITYFPFKSYFLGLPYLLLHLTLNLKKYKYLDNTFSSQTLINGTIGFAKKIGLLKRAKVILRESNSIFNLLKGPKLKIYTFFYHLGYKGSSMVICQTNYMKSQLISALPKLTSTLNLQVIPNPFNFEDIDKKSGEILPVLENKKFLVAAGRLAPAKGFDLLIESFYEISKSHDDLYLVILGEGKDREVLQNKINELKLEQKIYMPGYLQNVYSYFKKAKVCVLSSRIEGFPNVLLQMMSQNTKVVSTISAGGIDEIPGLFICPVENTLLLESSIKKALSTETSKNIEIFNIFLSKRTWSSFYNKIITEVTDN